MAADVVTRTWESMNFLTPEANEAAVEMVHSLFFSGWMSVELVRGEVADALSAAPHEPATDTLRPILASQVQDYVDMRCSSLVESARAIVAGAES